MSHITRILDRVQQREPKAADELLPLVYQELRNLAAAKTEVVNALNKTLSDLINCNSREEPPAESPSPKSTKT